MISEPKAKSFFADLSKTTPSQFESELRRIELLSNRSMKRNINASFFSLLINNELKEIGFALAKKRGISLASLLRRLLVVAIKEEATKLREQQELIDLQKK